MNLKNMISMAVAIIIGLTWLFPVYAAEFEGSIEIGAAQKDIDNESAKFMEYRGFDEDDTYFIGNVALLYSDEAMYTGITGIDLGLDTRNIILESGKYGRYKFFLEYDQLTKFISNSSRTIFDGAGSDNLTLPSGYVGNGSSSNPKTLVDQIINGTNGLGGSGNLKDVDLELERKSLATGFSMSLLKGLLDFNVDAKQEKKEGIKSIGAVVQDFTMSRGGPRSTVILPEPVDYTTDELRASIAYNREKAQLQLDYFLSVFNNADESLTWENPYYYGAPNPVISLPPDNRYHRWTLSGGLNLPLSTRLSFNAEYGKMEQDEDLLPYHANSASTANGTEPRDSAEAEIDTKLFNVNISSRPVSKLNFSARYRHYETDNKTPVDLFQYPVADGQNSVTVTTTGNGPAGSIYADGTSSVGNPCSTTNPCYRNFTLGVQGQAALNSAQARYNEPYEYRQDLVKVDLSYRLFNDTTMSLGYDHDVIKRDHRETDETKENIYRAGISKNISSYLSAGGNYLKGVRKYDEYDGASNLESHHQVYRNLLETTSVAPLNIAKDWINHPELRKFDLANRDREQYGAYAAILPHENITVGLNYSKGYNSYPDTKIGLKETDNETYTVDATFTPRENITVYGYYTDELLISKQLGRFMSGSDSSTWYDTTRDWTSTNRDSNEIYGIGMNLALLNDKLNVTPDYTFARSRTRIDLAGGSYFDGSTTDRTIETLPDLKTLRHTFNLSGRYKVTQNWTVGAGYLYEFYKSDDWSTDNMTLDDTATVPTNLVILSENDSNYTAHVGTVTLAYRW